MRAFPADIRSNDGDAPSGIVCPDCNGNIVVGAIEDGAADRRRLVFKCRVGHVYGLEELLIGKEAHIERTMWSALFAYEELAAILRDLGQRGGPDTDAVDDDERRSRIERADGIAAALRALIDRDESIRLTNPTTDG